MNITEHNSRVVEERNTVKMPIIIKLWYFKMNFKNTFLKKIQFK